MESNRIKMDFIKFINYKEFGTKIKFSSFADYLKDVSTPYEALNLIPLFLTLYDLLPNDRVYAKSDIEDIKVLNIGRNKYYIEFTKNDDYFDQDEFLQSIYKRFKLPFYHLIEDMTYAQVREELAIMRDTEFERQPLSTNDYVGQFKDWINKRLPDSYNILKKHKTLFSALNKLSYGDKYIDKENMKSISSFLTDLKRLTRIRNEWKKPYIEDIKDDSTTLYIGYDEPEFIEMIPGKVDKFILDRNVRSKSLFTFIYFEIFRKNTIDKKYDFVYINNILHEMFKKQQYTMIDTVLGFINNKGHVIVDDFYVDAMDPKMDMKIEIYKLINLIETHVLEEIDFDYIYKLMVPVFDFIISSKYNSDVVYRDDYIVTFKIYS